MAENNDGSSLKRRIDLSIQDSSPKKFVGPNGYSVGHVNLSNSNRREEFIDKSVLAEYNKLAIDNKPLDPNITIEEAQLALFNFKQEEVRKKQEASRNLAVKTIEELIQIAKDAELPKKEWDKLKKVELIKYLVDKI